MKQLPDSKTYEAEMLYMPYIKSLDKVLAIITEKAPQGSKLLDVMCGTGYFLDKIKANRNDLILSGMDLDERYVKFAKEEYPSIEFEAGDILSWSPPEQYDTVICTGSVHHIPYEKQDETIRRIANMAKPGGLVIISDCYVDNYNDELTRKNAAAKLGYEYLIETMNNGATDDVTEATIDILYNDVMKHEYKDSVAHRTPVFEKYFKNVEVEKTWPDTETEYGDYIMVCSK